MREDALGNGSMRDLRAARNQVHDSSAWVHELVAAADRALSRLVALDDTSANGLIQDVRALRERLDMQLAGRDLEHGIGDGRASSASRDE
jgi:hypothetical protein